MFEFSLVDVIYVVLIGVILCILVCLISMLSNAGKELKSRKTILKHCPFDNSHLLSDITLYLNASNTTQIDHVLLTRQGLYVIEEKNYNGLLEGRLFEKQWRKSIRGQSILLGNPFRQNIAHIHGIKRALKSNDIECINVVLINGKCQYRGPNKPEWLCFGVLEMVNKMRQQDSFTRFTPDELDAIKAALIQACLPKTLLTDLGHIISVSRKHHKKIPIVVLVSYYALRMQNIIMNGIISFLGWKNKTDLRKVSKKSNFYKMASVSWPFSLDEKTKG